jgi:alanine dehydrogenase
MLSFEILHKRIQRLPWYLQHRGHISASQCAGTSNCGKHVTNALRLGGNITDATQLTGEVAPKRVEVAHELRSRREAHRSSGNIIQHQRVACTNAIAARVMASEDAETLGLLGAGWQAHAHALAMSNVRNLKEIKIYSPTKSKREAFAKELGAKLNVQVRAVNSTEEATKGADIVGIATNSVTPVVAVSMLESHAHVSCLKELEIGDDVLERSVLIVVHTRHGRPANYIIGQGDDPIYETDPIAGVSDEFKKMRAARPPSKFDLLSMPDLGELVTGKVTLPPKGSMSCFVNIMGAGVQFAALGSLALERCQAKGLGRKIPTDWLLESIHN